MSVFLSHETSFGVAFQIAESRSILANDPHCKCANFFHGPLLTSIVDTGVISLLSSWGGNTIHRSDTNQKLAAGIRYHFSINISDEFPPNQHWCSLIYPASENGLNLIILIYTFAPKNITLRQQWNFCNINFIACFHPVIKAIEA